MIVDLLSTLLSFLHSSAPYVILALIGLAVGIVSILGAILLQVGIQRAVRRTFSRPSFAYILINVIMFIWLLA